MQRIVKGFCAAVLLGSTMVAFTTTQASALSTELAKKCRQMALTAYPPKPIGSKTGDAAEERNFFANCVAKGGKVSNSNDKQNAPAATPR